MFIVRPWTYVLAAALLCLSAPAWAVHQGENAPDFSLSSIDDETVTLADLSDRVVALVFWAGWGRHCDAELRQLEALANEFGDQPFVVIGINEREDREQILDFSQRHGLAFQMLIDDGAVARAFGVNGVPDLFILDREGVVLARFIGYSTSVADGIREALIEALAEPPRPEAVSQPGVEPVVTVPTQLQAYAHLQLGAAHLNIGDAFVRAGLRDAGHYREALAEFRAGLTLSPSSVDLHVWLGLALERQNDRASAVREYQTAIALDPVNVYAQDALRRLGVPWTSGPTIAPE